MVGLITQRARYDGDRPPGFLWSDRSSTGLPDLFPLPYASRSLSALLKAMVALVQV